MGLTHGDYDVGIDCDECGAHTNVDVMGAVDERLRRRGWKTDPHKCKECVEKEQDDAEEHPTK